MTSEDPRIVQFYNLIHEEEKSGIIDRKEHFEYANNQLPKGDNLIRFYHWILSLEVVPYQREKWDSVIQGLRNNYVEILNQHLEYDENFLHKPIEEEMDSEMSKLLQEVDNDMKRTVNSFRSSLISHLETSDLEIHTRRMERILILFAITEPDLNYIQGLNELILPIYTVSYYAGMKLNYDVITIEAVSMKLLSQLLIRNGLIVIYSSLENTRQIYQYFNVINKAIAMNDKELSSYFNEIGILNPMHYCFSWILTMFAQVLCFDDVIRLWDYLVILNENMVHFQFMMTAAIVLYKKRSIIGVKADRIIGTLHSIKDLPYIPILRIANSLYSSMYRDLTH
ncbi:MGC16169 protein, putative [Trichomonas vaginalis G3]|uniref:MGC16169 protein, putative n=1 Tax=Trichomonas vaginalis (strain ATCC PRA-98 / G3) TaxID=412133 RepID=A2EJQ1_TRIV3|nr:regulation of vesicle fusion [Trichomonas vaginalis G3]EAY07125.1 MGC16169 protein, putative [Trichomonas vaginalis G3]KAI5522480.1 regulation of vesicle fusion [Trichomonas vaginalis G3]|eukprot:XP_001319348.1 MGC16169 protein [Trichomonas vaginalis G3]